MDLPVSASIVSEPSFVGGFVEESGSVFATPGIVEKGPFDMNVEVTAPGGHSSVPPKHTVRFSVNSRERSYYSLKC